MDISIKKEEFVNINNLLESKALPLKIIKECVKHLPNHLVKINKSKVQIAKSLADAHKRVLNTNFKTDHWNLENINDVLDTAYWCALGGSFLADFASDPSQPRIFAWGMSPIKEGIKYTIEKIKGRDSKKTPTAACAPAESLIDFLDNTKLDLNTEMLVDYMSLGPIGIRVSANNNCPEYLVSDGKIQFILSGHHSLYMNLVRIFLAITGYKLMGISSANYSSHGPLAHKNKGTHKNLHEIQGDMGDIGIPILAGKITQQDQTPQSTIHEMYTLLHNTFLTMGNDQREKHSTSLIPTSVTVIDVPDNTNEWRVVRHGSIHYTVIKERLTKYNITIKLANVQRLTVSNYTYKLIK